MRIASCSLRPLLAANADVVKDFNAAQGDELVTGFPLFPWSGRHFTGMDIEVWRRRYHAKSDGAV